MEEMLRYLAETLRLMAENIVQLTEVQATQQTEIARHSYEMEKLGERQSETDQRFNILLDQVRFLSRRVDGQDQPIS
jgi:hypothetical protein